MSSETRSRARALRPWAIVAAAALVLLVGRAIFDGTASMHRSDELLQRGEVDGSIALALHAARMYVPLAPHVARAFDRMRQIALDAELRGDRETALLAWESVRAASRSTRTFWTPFADRAREADEHVAAILASQPTTGVQAPVPKDVLAREQRAKLQSDSLPRPWTIVLMYVGLAAWMIGAWRALSAMDREVRRLPARFGFASATSERVAMGVVVAIAGAIAAWVALTRA
jgi:hypothetical protein